jgi:hypothetical protein
VQKFRFPSREFTFDFTAKTLQSHSFQGIPFH